MTEKKNELKVKDSIGLFIKTVGHESFIIKVLVWMVTVLFAAVILLGAAVVIQSNKLTNIEPLVVYVDRDTGVAAAKEFDVVDARGEQRNENETWIFINDFIKNLYDYTKYSQLRNLENAYRLCDNSVQEKIKECFIRDGRPGRVKSEVVGLCRVESVLIMDTLPDLRVRAVYRKKVVQPGGSVILDKEIEAIMRIKTVVRSRYNPHGLYITDYRETVLKEKGGQ